jgi:phosphatidylserine decarboxylase
MVLVGGPCVNSIVADMAAGGTFKYTCSGWPGRNFGYISVADNVYSQGKVVVAIAGTRAADTRLAADVFQNYDTLLSGQTTAAVEITGTTTSPSIVAG